MSFTAVTGTIWRMRPCTSPGCGDLWQAVDRLIDRAPTDDDVRAHRLEVLAARRYRTLGRAIPPDFIAHERFARIVSLTTPAVLERVRDAYDGPAIVLKGPEVAARYPDPALRTYGDIDLLVPDAEGVHCQLLSAGFRPVGDPKLYVDIHHLRPVAPPGAAIHVELHSHPKWLDGLTPPPTDSMFASATPSATGTAGMLALPPAYEALLVTVHSWAHEPLRRLRDMIDVAVVASAADRVEIARLADAWGVKKLWATTIGAVDALFGNGRPPWALRVWAKNLPYVRERTVLENHLETWLSDFWALPPPAAARRLPATLLDEIRPAGDERWREKIARTSLALTNARQRRSHHHRALEKRSRRSS